MKMGFFAVRAILAVGHERRRKGQKGFFMRRSVTVKLLHNPYAIVPLPASVFSDAVDEVLK